MAEKSNNESGGEAAAAIRVLVTGGTGLVGSAIRQVLVATGCRDAEMARQASQ